jgi:HlyD family secretion protein
LTIDALTPVKPADTHFAVGAHGDTQAAASPSPASALSWLKAHKWLVILAVIIGGLALWQGYRFSVGASVAVDTVVRGNLVETVVASGHIETPYRVEIGSQMTGTVASVAVREGQSVKAGQLLIALEPHELAAGVVQAQGVVAQAEAHMRQLRELTLPSARDNLKAALASQLGAAQIQGRAAALAAKGFETRAFLDEAQKNLDVARTAARTAAVQVQTASPGGSDYVTGETELAQARAGLVTAQSRLAYARISAPRDGVLISRQVEQGNVVVPGAVLMVLAPAGVTQLILLIDERNLGKIALGQPAVASADAYPGKRFAASVAYINPGIDITRASMAIKLDVPAPPPYLRQDMTVSVDIEVARRNGVLAVPGRSVRDALSTRPWVMVLQNGRARRQDVTLGVVGNSQTEIKAGVQAGDQLIPAGSPIVAGARARTAAPVTAIRR